MIEGLDRIGAKAPVSLTRDGVFQLGGVRRAAPLLVSRHEVFAWTAPRSLSEEDILRFVRDLAAGKPTSCFSGLAAPSNFPRPASEPKSSARTLASRSWTPPPPAAHTMS